VPAGGTVSTSWSVDGDELVDADIDTPCRIAEVTYGDVIVALRLESFFDFDLVVEAQRVEGALPAKGLPRVTVVAAVVAIVLVLVAVGAALLLVFVPRSGR
jgi:hypothetical protein